MKKQELVDMDGVLADVYSQFLRFEYKDLGIEQKIEDRYGKTEIEAFKNCDKYVRSEGFYKRRYND